MGYVTWTRQWDVASALLEAMRNAWSLTARIRSSLLCSQKLEPYSSTLVIFSIQQLKSHWYVLVSTAGKENGF